MSGLGTVVDRTLLEAPPRPGPGLPLVDGAVWRSRLEALQEHPRCWGRWRGRSTTLVSASSLSIRVATRGLAGTYDFRTSTDDEGRTLVCARWTPPADVAVRACRGCGCTDDRACPGGCWWVEDDLCSACGSIGLLGAGLLDVDEPELVDVDDDDEGSASVAVPAPADDGPASRPCPESGPANRPGTLGAGSGPDDEAVIDLRNPPGLPAFDPLSPSAFDEARRDQACPAPGVVPAPGDGTPPAVQSPSGAGSTPYAATPAVSWRQRALCRDLPPDLFFVERGDTGFVDALELCGRCPVRDECLEYALGRNDGGIWGGTTPRERQRLRRQRGIRLATPQVDHGFAASSSPEAARRRRSRARRAAS